ncbi:MAG: Tex-like N-terminal domain-containing protein, partial [Microcoleus sp.]
MLNIPQLIAQELAINLSQVNNALELFAEGATIPFIARYRKERTDLLNEIQLRDISDRFTYLTEIEDRKKSILDTIASQDKLTEELQAKIESCLQKNELEDLYLPYKPKRRTRATIAREKGLEPLAIFIKCLNLPTAQPADMEAEAAKYVSEEKGVKTAEEALKGAGDILAEAVSEKAELRAYLREFLMKTGVFVSKIKADFPEGSTKFEMYRNYQVAARNVQSHNMLALFRGETEGVLDLELTFDESAVMAYLESQEIRTRIPEVKEFYRSTLKDAFNRLMKTSLMTEVRSHNKAIADIESIATFETNLRELLLSAPAGMKPTLAIDPGFRTGCKVSALDETGQFLEYQAIFPHQAVGQRQQAGKIVKHLIEKYKIELIAIGNGT